MANVRTFNLIVLRDDEAIVLHRNLSRVAAERYKAYYSGEYQNISIEIEPCF